MSNQAFPESELPRWLYRKSRTHVVALVRAIPGYDYVSLSRFSHDLHVCLRSSTDLARGMELCVKTLHGTRLGDQWSDAGESIRQGATLAEALSPARNQLPPFFLPVVRAGERSGRIDDAFLFLHTHCKLLAGPASAIRKMWLYPLIILAVGSAIRVFLSLLLGSILAAIGLMMEEIFGWLKIALIVFVATIPPVLQIIDQVRLSLPLLGALEREMAVHRFFRVLGLVYSVGDDRVESMIRTAAQAVTNQAAKSDLLSAATAIERGATIPDAFATVNVLTNEEKASIVAGDLSGTLERTFDHLSDNSEGSMMAKLNIINPLLTRLVMAVVVFSIVGTMLRLITTGDSGE